MKSTGEQDSLLPDDLDVWILAGQSNMQGCGFVAEGLPAHPQVWSFTSAGQWALARDPLHEPWTSSLPVYRENEDTFYANMTRGMSEVERQAWIVQQHTIGVGPGMAFGRAMAEGLQRPVGLLPVAMGGSSLGKWSPTHKGEGGRSLFGAMLERTRQCQRRVAGLLWYQGESDVDAISALTYGARLEQWIAAVRKELQAPELPIVLVQLGRYLAVGAEAARYWDQVRAAQYELPLRVPHTAVTSAIDLGMFDCVHLNARAQNRLGARLARLALGIPGPRVVAVERVSATRFEPCVVRVVCTGVTGVWKPSDVMTGFAVCTASGVVSAQTAVTNAGTDPGDGSAIRVLLSCVPEPGEVLVYGSGPAPLCSVTDEVDMPLCAFQLPLRNLPSL